MHRLAEPLLGDRHQVIPGEGTKAVFDEVDGASQDIKVP
jgi:hypothetical protein